MLEVGSLDDVGRALDIVNERQIPLAMSLGRHTNDHMTSFYVRTPSGFEIEYGTGGLLVDDTTWEIGHFDAISYWGHKPPPTGPLLPTIMRPTYALIQILGMERRPLGRRPGALDHPQGLLGIDLDIDTTSANAESPDEAFLGQLHGRIDLLTIQGRRVHATAKRSMA